MGLLDLFKKGKQINNNAPVIEEILIPKRSEPQPPFIPTNKKQIIPTGYKSFYKNGVLYNVTPRNKKNSLHDDRQTAYDAQYIVLNNIEYNLEDEASIEKIVVPRYDDNVMHDMIFDLAYILKMRLGKEERPHLAVPLAYKTANIMIASTLGWMKKDYYRLVVKLWSIGEFAYGDYLLKEIKSRLPFVAAEDEYRVYHEDAFKKALDLASQLKTDYLETSHQLATCEKCAPYQNRVYCISGKDKRFPKLPDFIKQSNGSNCSFCLHYSPFVYYNGRTITRYLLNENSIVTEIELDAIKHSNRAFEDDRTLAEKQRYLEWKQQNEKRLDYEKRYYDRNTWVGEYLSRFEYYEIVNKLEEKAPKSFNGYMKMKRGNTSNYQKLITLAKEKAIVINELPPVYDSMFDNTFGNSLKV